MSFTIKCDKCNNEMKIIDNKSYIDGIIDLYPYEDIDSWGYLEKSGLSIYCNNDDCKNEIDIYC